MAVLFRCCRMYAKKCFNKLVFGYTGNITYDGRCVVIQGSSKKYLRPVLSPKSLSFFELGQLRPLLAHVRPSNDKTLYILRLR